MIPTWLVQLGSMAGLFTFGFTVFDRLFEGRPIVSLGKSDYGKRNVRCSNTSASEIFIKSVGTFPRYARVAKDDSPKGIMGAALKSHFQAICPPASKSDFPVVFLDGRLMNPDSSRWAPFIIMVFWRKTRSVWLPQIPAMMFTSARTIRRLESLH
jgi:hypothetical protein